MRPALLAAALLIAAASLLPLARPAAPPALVGPHRSPIDLALLPDGRHALTANHTADSVSLLDLRAGKVLAEVPCGRRPAGVACSPDGKRVAVADLDSGTLSLFTLAEGKMTPAGRVAVGPRPRGLAFAADGQLYAVVSATDEVVTVDFGARKVTGRWPAPRAARHLALSADGRWLATAGTRSGQVRLWDRRAGKVAWARKIEDGFNLRGLTFTPDGKALVVAHVVRRAFPVSKDNIDKGWVIDSRLTRLPVAADATPPLEQIALDRRGQAVGDPHAPCFDPAGRTLAVSASGTHELLLLQASAVPWSGGDPGDFLDFALSFGDRFRRVELGGRPLALAFRPGAEELVVANYLLDAVQLVDTRAGRLVKTIPLGSPARPGLARRGEALFYDARRSHHHWFSCNTCHPDGHTSGQNFDTLNDDTYGDPKLALSLRGVRRTGPWTWHGWQKDLGAAVTKSFVDTMFGPKPTAEEVRAVVAYLGTLEHPPSPRRAAGGKLSPAANRGQALFEGKARCARCHQSPDYTTPRNYDVKLESDGSPFEKWNPPTLRGLWDRGPFLHDSRAGTLDEVLTRWHAPEKLGGKSLTEAERRDLIAFLESL